MSTVTDNKEEIIKTLHIKTDLDGDEIWIDQHVTKGESDAILALIEQRETELVHKLFPEYDTVTNPGHTFMINKNELDEALQYQPKETKEGGS